MQKGQIIKALAGFYYVKSQGQVYQCRARGKFRKDSLKPLVGDYCEFSIENQTEGYILSLLPRKNSLIRPPICNVDQALLVFSAKEPDMNLLLLDRFLILIEHLQIQPIICISKMDLVDSSLIYHQMKPYEDAGYQVLYVSSKQEQGIEAVKNSFKDKVTVVTGQSGVGKSSLLNALDIHLQIDTNEISKALGRGKHTTRIASLYHFKNGFLGDTPGFSKLDLQDIKKDELKDYFVEFTKFKCKFKDCLHEETSKGCKVREEVGQQIKNSRYLNYLKMLEAIKKENK